jgi:hypothetical protein
MWKGLQAMSAEELGLGARLAGWRTGRDPATRQELLGQLLDWVGTATGSSTREPDDLDTATANWLARVAGIDPLPEESPQALEARVWELFSEEAARQLMPIWRVGSCMAALGPPDALVDEKKLLDRVAARLLPSEKARETMRAEWEAWCARPARHHSEFLERLAPDLEFLAGRPELAEPTLILALVVALADSSFELEESRLYDRIASALGVDAARAAQLKEKVSRAFWDSREKLMPRGPSPGVPGTHEASLRAAHESLEAAGGLEGLQEEINTGFLAGLHKGLLQDRDFQRGMKAWRKTPLHWPVGLAVGLSLFLKGRMKASSERNLLQFLYLVRAREVLGPEG